MWLCRKLWQQTLKLLHFDVETSLKSLLDCQQNFFQQIEAKKCLKVTKKLVRERTKSNNGKGWQIHTFNTKNEYLNMAGSFFLFGF